MRGRVAYLSADLTLFLAELPKPHTDGNKNAMEIYRELLYARYHYNNRLRPVRQLHDDDPAQSTYCKNEKDKIANNIEKLEDAWRKKVIQFQIPILSEATKGKGMILRFENVIADALGLSTLRTESIRPTDEQEQWLAEMTLQKVPLPVTRTLTEYCLANKPAVSGWYVLSVTNTEACPGGLGTESDVPETI